MDEARPITTTRRRIAGWLRAIRGIAGTYNAVQAQAPELQELRRGVEGLARSHREMISQNTAKLDATAKQVADAREQISKMLDGMKDVVAAQHAFTAAQETVRATQESVVTALQRLSASQQELHRSVDDVRNTQNALRSCQEQLGEKYARLAPTMPQLALAGGRDPATWLYAAFEETFRGTREQIRGRLATYIPDVRAAHATTAGTAIDVGCGRGEWLELMRDAGIGAVGVDENALVVDQCTELGLDAVHGDAISYLAHVPEQTAAAITAFHVIEHLPLARQLQLMVAAYRVIAPDGVLILETPNPENLVVGAWTFHMDPSHLRPLPPTLLRFLLEAVGFDVAEIRRLNFDDGLGKRAAQENWPAGIQQMLCGPRDFGVIARRRKS